MADGDYPRLRPACHCGKPAKLNAGPGRPSKRCEEHIGSPHPKPEKQKIECPACRGFFVPSSSKQQFCSRDCARRTRRGNKPRQLWPLKCVRCGVDFESINEKAMYCTKLCKLSAFKERRKPGYIVTSMSVIKERAEVARAEREWRSAAHKAMLAASAARRKAREAAKEAHSCIRCGEKLPSECSFARKFCTACSAERLREANRAKKRTPAGRAAKRKDRLARKLKIRAVVVDVVDPIKVFERDGWRCQLCGRRAPERKRGTYDDDAPELDHIIPISKGGEHSYRNTQCACRGCNGSKGARPMGQTLLFG